MTLLPGAKSSFWISWLGLDLRSLALLRVMLAISCLAQIVTLWPDVPAFFSDTGLYSRADYITTHSPNYYWSVYFINGSSLWAYSCLSIATLASLALLLGYHTRLACFLCWVLASSITVRLMIFTSGADMLLPLYLFWSMFLPLGARFSVDEALCTGLKSSNTYFSAASCGMLVQVACLYIFSALWKSAPPWHNGLALYYLFHGHSYAQPAAIFVAQWPGLLPWLTYYIYYLEISSWLLIFSPIKTQWTRLIIVSLLIILHLSFVVYLGIYFFPLVCLSGLTILIPAIVWDKLGDWLNHLPRRNGIIIYYDQDCGFCRKVCLIFRSLGLPPQTRIEPAQANPEMYAIMQRENSWVVAIPGGGLLTRWEAVAWVMRHSPLLWPIGLLFLPPFMRRPGDALYGLIAHNRGRLAQWSARWWPEPSCASLVWRPAAPTQCLLAFLSFLTVLWNISGLQNHQRLSSLRPYMFPVLSALKLDQQMSFFAPNVPMVSEWVEIHGTLGDGHQVDVLHNRFDDTLFGVHSFSDIYPNEYWTKYFLRIPFQRHAGMLGHYFCSQWHEHHPELPLKQVDLYRYVLKTPEPGAPLIPARTAAAIHYNCKRQALIEPYSHKPL